MLNMALLFAIKRYTTQWCEKIEIKDNADKIEQLKEESMQHNGFSIIVLENGLQQYSIKRNNEMTACGTMIERTEGD